MYSNIFSMHAYILFMHAFFYAYLYVLYACILFYACMFFMHAFLFYACMFFMHAYFYPCFIYAYMLLSDALTELPRGAGYPPLLKT